MLCRARAQFREVEEVQGGQGWSSGSTLTQYKKKLKVQVEGTLLGLSVS